MSLADLAEAEECKTDKGWYHNYLPLYERHLPPREDVVSLLEIGVLQGQSLRLWERWFTHPDTRITGLDTSPAHRYDSDRVKTLTQDATNWDVPGDLTWDVIIDDGSHNPDDVLASWRLLWKHVKPGGIYVIEDLQVQSHLAETSVIMSELLVETKRVAVESRWRDAAEVHVYPRIWFMRKRV